MRHAGTSWTRDPSQAHVYQRPASWPPTCQRGGDVTTHPGGGYKQGGRQLTFSLRTAIKGATPPVGLHIGRPKDRSQTYGARCQSLQTIGTTSRSTTTRPTSTSQRLRLRERKATIQGDQVSAMDEVIAGSQPKQQQGSSGSDERGRRSRDTTNNDVDRGRSQPRPWTLPQFRLRIREEDGSVTRHHRGQGIRTVPTFPVNSWEIKHLWIPVFIMICTLHGVHSLPTPEFGVLHQFTAYDCNDQLQSRLSNSPATASLTKRTTTKPTLR